MVKLKTLRKAEDIGAYESVLPSNTPFAEKSELKRKSDLLKLLGKYPSSENKKFTIHSKNSP